ncbi:MAG: TrmH family RNA methyltransferase [Candidatus Omnitrophota bacterium]
MRKLTHEEIVLRQAASSAAPRIPVVVVLDNVRSLNNVGAVFRTADGAGIEKLWLCGITGYPPRGEIARTALGAEESVPWEYAREVLSVVEYYRGLGYQIVLLEQAEGAVLYEDYVPSGAVCLVLGNEIDGVADALAALADTAIEIPMAGVKNSLNVAAAFAVAIFHLRRVMPRRNC